MAYHKFFLPPGHQFRRDSRSFKRGRSEEQSSLLLRLLEEQIWNQDLPKITETRTEFCNEDCRGKDHNWSRSIFLDLPYWCTLLVHHNIDVMHNEKNVFDNMFNTVMDVKGKSKDNIMTRKDLGWYCNRPDLLIDESGRDKRSKPTTCYNLTKEQKKIVLD